LIHIDLLLTILSFFLALIFTVYTLIRNITKPAGRVFAAVSFSAAILFLPAIAQQLSLSVIPAPLAARVFFAALLVTITLACACVSLFPETGRTSARLLLYAAGLPGYGITVLALAGNMVIADASWGTTLQYSKGPLFGLYAGALPVYAALMLLFPLIRAGKEKNIVIRTEILYFLCGIVFCIASGIALMPRFHAVPLHYAFISVPGGILLVLMNHSILDPRSIDFRNLYVRMVYWILIFILMFAPVLLLLYFNAEAGAKITLPEAILSVLLFLYLFIFFRYLKPRIENLFQGGYRKITSDFNDFFQSITELSGTMDQENFWDDYYNTAIKGFLDRFGIKNGAFYLYNEKDKKFIQYYGFGETGAEKILEQSHPVLKAVEGNTAVISRSDIYLDSSLNDHRQDIFSFFDKNGIEVIMPFLNHELRLIGILFLGPPENRKIYPRNFLSALELYRIQFQHHLSNGLFLEEVKATQVLQHDKMAVSDIKNRLTPEEMQQISGIRISSFHMNNSNLGGDYFDSIRLSDDRMALLIADTSYAGIDSAILALELYSAFHSSPDSADTADKILNSINWVIATSALSDRYAAATCAVLSSDGNVSCAGAAHNPLMLYDPAQNEFSEAGNGGIPIGAKRDYGYESRSFRLKKGTIGYLYSDGLTSSINQSGEIYDHERVKGIIRSHAEKSPALLAREVYRDYRTFSGNLKQNNDVTMIIFKA